jgi:hypothetical protein
MGTLCPVSKRARAYVLVLPCAAFVERGLVFHTLRLSHSPSGHTVAFPDEGAFKRFHNKFEGFPVVWDNMLIGIHTCLCGSDAFGRVRESA